MRSGKKVLLFFMTFIILFTSCAVPGMGGSRTLTADSSELKRTIITPHLEEKISQGRNILYCSTFQLAWNELEDNIIRDNIKLEGNPGMAEILNKRTVDKSSLSKEAYIAMSGYGREDIINKINASLKEKFKDNAPIVEENLRPDDIISYAYLYKNLEFEKEFERIKNPLIFNGQEVEAFGITDEKTKDARGQVNVIDYKSPDDFVISLNSKSDKDEIILAKVSPGDNMLKTYEAVQGRIKNGKPQKFGDDDRLIVPKFDFDIKADYDELTGKNLMNKGFEDYQVTKAFQQTKFRLNEKGAVLKSEAKIIMQKSIKVTRSFVFDKPFMIILKEKKTNMPYFILWVDNDELMVKK